MKHTSIIELSLSALKNNINFIRRRIGKEAKICSVVKANAYGHGISTYIPMLEKAGVKYFAVASSFEADEVYEAASPDARIMIMGILYDRDLEEIIGKGMEFYVFHYDKLVKAVEIAKKLGKPAKVHLEVETGCNRTGLSQEDLDNCIKLMKKNPEWVEFVGLCTHFAGIESLSNHFRTTRQYVRYKEFLSYLKKKKMEPELRHIACSAAAIAFPDTALDMVRVGVAQFGFWPSPDVYNLYISEQGNRRERPLKRVITWKTDIMDIKHVQEHEFIGYGTSYQAQRDMRVAVLPLGYSNGYSRSLSNKGYVLIHGRKAPIVGLINMNLFTVDITHIPEAQLGDEVVLIGKQKNNTISVSSFTNFSNQLNNELISRLPAAIPRVAKV
ncbi:MAG: alanine racemase [Bernardetiaceae bacterium]|nr:alanine racemase [Bernardetiaceae bacterium]